MPLVSLEAFCFYLQHKSKTMRLLNILLLTVIFVGGCKSKGDETPKPDMAFDKSKWNLKSGNGDYTFRSQMVKDILKNYNWAGVKKDSLLQMLGQPNLVEEGSFVYYYEMKPGFIGSSIEAIKFQVAADSTIKKAGYSEDGFD